MNQHTLIHLWLCHSTGRQKEREEREKEGEIGATLREPARSGVEEPIHVGGYCWCLIDDDERRREKRDGVHTQTREVKGEPIACIRNEFSGVQHLL